MPGKFQHSWSRMAKIRSMLLEDWKTAKTFYFQTNKMKDTDVSKIFIFQPSWRPNGALNRPCEADLSRPMVKKGPLEFLHCQN